MSSIARRRSGVVRAPIPTTARKTVRSTPGSKPSIDTPLPKTSTTGRTTTLGIPECSTLNRTRVQDRLATTCTRLSTPVTRPLPRSVTTARSTRPPAPAPAVRGGRTAPTTQRNHGVVGTHALFRGTHAVVSLRTRAPAPSRPPPELIKAMEQNARLQEQVDRFRERYEMLTEKKEQLSIELADSKEMIDMLKEKLQQKTLLSENLAAQLNTKEAEMRQLHNTVVDLKGQIRVVLRIRPFLPSDGDATSCVVYPAVNEISIQQGAKPSPSFPFERVFTELFSQQEVFDNISDFVLSALHGFNVGLIAFGQTGSGKTHTMRGGDQDGRGVIPRAGALLFAESEKLKASGWEFEFILSFLEIYNNAAFDLLDGHKAVTIRLNGQDVRMDGLSEHRLAKLSDMEQLLRRADNNRKTAATKCNEQSSRSHAVYMWRIKAHQISTGLSTTSTLKLVDLAGSERAKESGVTGQQFTEMTAINNSLSVLQKCVSLQKAKSPHVPYRETKLTQVLMDCLGRGNSKTMVIVNVNPSSKQMLESKRSVEFAAKMRGTHVGTAVQQRDTTIS